MQRTSESRKKSLKKPSTISQSVPIPSSNPIITTPDHPGCWRIIKNEIITPSPTMPVNPNHPSITYRNSVFSIHDRIYTRLSFQNYNKRIDPLMIKYGLKEETNKLEDGEIDPNDDNDDDENEKKISNEDNEPTHVTTLVKTIRKKFQKKPFSRIQFDNKTRITKRRRRTRQGPSTN
jgi:hypothetical protein